VRVCVRKRPLSKRDIDAGERDVISTGTDESLFVHEVKHRLDLTRYVDSHPFAFDRVFSEEHDNENVYTGTARPLVDTLFAGGRGTCFAYGQTGTGKTHTMEGQPGNPGLYLLAVRDVFKRLVDNPGLTVWISFFEIYGTRLHDLLNNRAKIECREDAQCEVRIVGLTERRAEHPDQVLDLIARAAAARSTGVTGANDDSSRSHAVFQIELRSPPPSETYSQTASDPSSGAAAVAESLIGSDANASIAGYSEVGRLSFVDLAGSERGSDTANATAQTRREGAEINKSLLALKECIRAMDQRKDHTPFRGSKLTQVLKASFTGRANCCTVMIANVSPASLNVEHTLNTLRYSQRVKEMKSSSSPESRTTAAAVQAYSYGVPSAARGSLGGGSNINITANQSGSGGSGNSLRPTIRPALITQIESPELHSLSSDPGQPMPVEQLLNKAKPYGLVPPTQRRSGLIPMYKHSSNEGHAKATADSTAIVGLQTATFSDRDTPSDSVGVSRSSRPNRRRVPTAKSLIPSTRSASLRRASLASDEIPDLVIEPPRTRARAAQDQAAAAAAAAASPSDSLLCSTGGAHLRRMNSTPVQRRRESLSRSSSRDSGLSDEMTPPSQPRSVRANDELQEAFDDELLADTDLLYAMPVAAATVSAAKPNVRRMIVPANRRRATLGPGLVEPVQMSGLNETPAQARPGSIAPARAMSETTGHVVALHREKAEELTALMKEGVELMRAVEDGRLAGAAYATKLEINLALSMDLLHTLKTQVAVLGAKER
jgi:Kinesin motor domain